MNKLIGYTNQKRLIDIFKHKKSSLEPIINVQAYTEKTRCDIIGVVDETPKTGKSKSGNSYAKFQISDETGIIKVMIFKERMEQCKTLNNGLPKEGDIVIISGTKMEGDVLFADNIACQQNKIYTSLIQLKDKFNVKDSPSTESIPDKLPLVSVV